MIVINFCNPNFFELLKSFFEIILIVVCIKNKMLIIIGALTK